MAVRDAPIVTTGIQQIIVSIFSQIRSATLFKKYDVDYIMISSWERNSFTLDESLFDQMFTCVFISGDIRIYQIHQL